MVKIRERYQGLVIFLQEGEVMAFSCVSDAENYLELAYDDPNRVFLTDREGRVLPWKANDSIGSGTYFEITGMPADVSSGAVREILQDYLMENHNRTRESVQSAATSELIGELIALTGYVRV